MGLSEFFEANGPFSRIWNSSKVGVPVWLCAAGLTVYWLFSVPPPGKAIGALAVVAGIMSVRDIRVLGRVLWVFLLIWMTITEFRAIDKDRADNAQQQKDFFDAQKAGFQSIATQNKADFEATAGGLKSAIDGLNANLTIATKTFQQTQPQAALVITQATFLNGPKPPARFASGVDYMLNFFYMNNGTDQGLLTKRLGRIYVAKPDDLDAQKEVASEFESDWKNAAPVKVPTPVQAGEPKFWMESLEISQDDESKLTFKGDTLYVVRRIEYKDRTGTWLSDRCDHYQVSDHQMWIEVFHPCQVLMNGRYRSKPH